MKKVAFISIIIFIVSNTVLFQSSKTDDLIDIASALESERVTIDNWEVTLKEKIGRSQLNELMNELKDSHKVTRDENKNSIQYEVVNNIGELNTVIKAIFPKDNQYTSEFVVVLYSEVWNDEVKSSYVKELKNLEQTYFTKDVKKFSCITTTDDAIIKSDKFLSNLTNYLELRHIEKQTDNIQTSKQTEIIYAYSPLWRQSITIQDKPSNIQIVMEYAQNGSVQVTIGTPILINEY
ncbi:YwmB family TATA-box binding protein [Ornithinibacillus halophilus]|uniref:TATA-box binding n=1 Tax=Ornithinibacillus halophilus TaxID=930117 RepID=A0A1M5LY61_9BACI|nr:YwmB family TATA-box binding protein [Ornithinibacillus halophilus]SHG69333.1 TATA-box binding [Ornithinibacillus halophilus]